MVSSKKAKYLLFIITLIMILIIIEKVAKVRGEDVTSCSNWYANDIANIIGREYYDVIKDTLDELSNKYPSSIHDPEANTKLIMNIGPGTSGTRSLYIAATQLNLTSFHSGTSSLNCSAYNHHEKVNLDSLFDIETMEIMNTANVQYALWGDIPAPYYWWNILHRFRERAMFIMTDFDDDLWLKVRRGKEPEPIANFYWTVPIAFHPDELHFNNPEISLEEQNKITKTLLHKLNVWFASTDTNKRCFDAFRRFVRCAIPPEKLLWLHMHEEKSPTFWKKLINFIGLEVSKVELDMLIDGGVPYWGSKGSFVGNTNFSFVDGFSNPTPNLCQRK